MPAKIPGYPRTHPGHIVPRSEAPPADDDIRDSREITEDSLLEEYKAKADALRAAEARAHAAELELAALTALKGESAPPRAPSFGNAKWWIVALGVIGTLAAITAATVEVASKVHEWDRPTASAAQVADLRLDFADRDRRDATRDAAEEARRKDEDQRARLLGAFMCQLGFRARGLDCDQALHQVAFEPQPLNPHGAPTYRTKSTWPAPPDVDP